MIPTGILRRAALLGGLFALAVSAPAGARLAVSVFASVPAPGYPSDVLVAPDGTVYAGSFHSFTTASDTGPAKVFAFSPAGKLERTYTISGETPGQPHGVQVAAIDRSGLLYLLDQAPARIVRLNPATGAQSTWATFASVPACVDGQPAGACTDGLGGSAPEPDLATWGPDGSLYVTDYTQDLIWRVPPTGGKATVWLTEPGFNGIIVGPSGIELMPGGHELMFDTGGGGGDDITTGKLYTVPIEAGGSPGPVTQLWQSGPLESPDGFAIARSGHIYVALVGPAGNAVDELSATGAELARVPANGLANSQLPIPFDAPGSVTFDGDNILVANESALLNDTSDMAVLEVGVGEPGLPLSLPPAAPALRCVLRVHPARVIAGRRRRFRFVVKAGVEGHLGPLAGVLVRFDGHRARTNRSGRVVIVARLRGAGRRYRARAVRSGVTPCAVAVRSRRP